MSQKIIRNIGTCKINNDYCKDLMNLNYRDSTDTCQYTFIGLEPISAYYVIVTAVNDHGEGYKSKNP